LGRVAEGDGSCGGMCIGVWDVRDRGEITVVCLTVVRWEGGGLWQGRGVG